MTSSSAVAASARRLAVGLALSVGIHLLAALNMSPVPAGALAWPLPLQVDIQHAMTPEPVAAFTPPPELSGYLESAARVPLPAAAQPQQMPSGAPAAPDLALLTVPVDRYFSAKEVDVRAAQSNEVELIYPQLAYDRRIEGKLKLRIFINELGGIDRVTVLEATPPGVFEEATLAATWALKFSPALISGRPVKSTKTIEVVFNPLASADTR